MKKYLYILLVFPLLFSCERKKSATPPPLLPVSVAKAERKDVPIYIEAIGHVTSLATVDVRSRVEGELQEVLFKEGDEVEKGKLLFVIDPRPYENTKEKIQAELQENIAKLQLAQDRLARYTLLAQDNYVSELNMDSLQSEVAQLKAVIRQNKADIAQTELNIAYCHIYSPIQGKTGILKIDKGNLIAPNDQTPLITINTISPIYVLFSIPEKDFARVQEYRDKNEISTHILLNNTTIKGALNLIDNQVDTKTAMIKLRAICDNHDKKLWPGQFVKTHLILTIQKNALIIPNEAIVFTETGPQVFTIQKDNQVSIHSIKMGEQQAHKTIILAGLEEGETIVIEGQINLTEGSKVYIANEVHAHESL
ncbi:MAG: efflux RND transporter periplasmic adaptor subunit [Parachlamydiales bacterium]|nr:efflux RND transporter periplasmic adaptor subunit [Parachlamydiales bacterium]